MAAISNNINNKFDNIGFRNKLNKSEDSKVDSYVLRKHINYSISNCFISKENPAVSSFVSPLKQSSKSQLEELQKLQAEISHVEDSIRELEVSKKVKLTKIEDLRNIIERIADEDCFDCVFTTRPNNIRIAQRERGCSATSAKKPRVVDSSSRQGKATTDDQTTNNINNNIDSTEEGAAEGEDGEGTKQGINCTGCCSYCHCEYHRLLREDVLQQSLSYWQEHLAAPKRLFKA